MWFHSWHDLLRVLVVGSTGYAGLVLMLRVTGKRTLSKMNAFDFIVTVAFGFGSTLATMLLSSEVSLAEGLTALALLCTLQYAVAATSVRSERFQRLVKAEPTMLVFRGRFLGSMLRKERVTEEEVMAAARSQGMADWKAVAAVILETDGSFSVIAESDGEPLDTLRYVRGAEQCGAQAVRIPTLRRRAVFVTPHRKGDRDELRVGPMPIRCASPTDMHLPRGHSHRRFPGSCGCVRS